MPTTLEDFIWLLFIALVGVLIGLLRHDFKKIDGRIKAIEEKKVLTTESCTSCLTKAIAEAVRAELNKLAEKFAHEVEVIRGKQEELRNLLPEKYAKREDFKDFRSELRERFESIDNGIQLIIEEGFRRGQQRFDR